MSPGTQWPARKRAVEKEHMDNRRPSQGRAGYPGNRDRQMQPRKVFIAEHADEPEQPVDEEQHDEPRQEQDDTHADQDDDQNDLPEDEHPGEADELPDLTEVAEVLTVTAKRLSGLKLGRKFTGGPRKDTRCLEEGDTLPGVRRERSLEG